MLILLRYYLLFFGWGRFLQYKKCLLLFIYIMCLICYFLTTLLSNYSLLIQYGLDQMLYYLFLYIKLHFLHNIFLYHMNFRLFVLFFHQSLPHSWWHFYWLFQQLGGINFLIRVYKPVNCFFNCSHPSPFLLITLCRHVQLHLLRLDPKYVLLFMLIFVVRF